MSRQQDRAEKRKQARKGKQRIESQVSTARRKLRADLNIVAVRRIVEGEIIIGVRAGLFGHPSGIMLRVDDASIAGCVEDKGELAKLVNNMGILCLSQLFGHNLAEGIDKLGDSIASWAGIDVEALRAAAAADAASETPSAEDYIPGPADPVQTEATREADAI